MKRLVIVALVGVGVAYAALTARAWWPIRVEWDPFNEPWGDC